MRTFQTIKLNGNMDPLYTCKVCGKSKTKNELSEISYTPPYNYECLDTNIICKECHRDKNIDEVLELEK